VDDAQVKQHSAPQTHARPVKRPAAGRRDGVIAREGAGRVAISRGEAARYTPCVGSSCFHVSFCVCQRRHSRIPMASQMRQPDSVERIIALPSGQSRAAESRAGSTGVSDGGRAVAPQSETAGQPSITTAVCSHWLGGGSPRSHDGAGW
jgi:hypothetical protein